MERHRGPLPQELMPLPSSERDSPLEWTHLVDVASTFENERNTHYSKNTTSLHVTVYWKQAHTQTFFTFVRFCLRHSSEKLRVRGFKPSKQRCIQSSAVPHGAAPRSAVPALVKVNVDSRCFYMLVFHVSCFYSFTPYFY